MLPSELLDYDIKGEVVATDTETSGLFADDGARVSTASIAFEVPMHVTQANGMLVRRETIVPGYEVNIASMAWPFDQGLVEGKPEYHGQETLWPEANNLDSFQWRALLEWLAEQHLTMHHAKFDCEKYRVGVRRWPGLGVDLSSNVVWDTQNTNNQLWPLHPTSLKPTCERLFGAEYGDESRLVQAYLKKSKLPKGRWDLIPWDIIGTYADLDSRLTLMLRMRQIWEIDHNGAGSWFYAKLGEAERNDREVLGLVDTDFVYDAVSRRLDTTGVLYRMEWRGLPYDEVESRLAADECRDRAKPIVEALPFKPTGPEAKKFFFGDGKTSKGVECLNMVPYSTTDKGEPSLTAEILERMVDDEIPIADRWLEYTKVTNAASMWYEGYADKMGQDGRLRTCYRQNGTVSTRFSVERVNLQAIPQDYRLSAYEVLAGIPTPRELIAMAVAKMTGMKIYELDLAQAELRVAAMFAGCTTMLDLIQRGKDLHAVTTGELFKMKPTHAEWGKYRQVGKRGNFSLIFGSAWLTFQKMVSKETGIRLQDHESQRIVADWNRLYPEFRVAIDRHSTVVAKRQAKHHKGWIDLVNGERRWFQPYEETHKAFNQRVQGNLAQFGIDWMIQTDAFLRAKGYGEQNGQGLVLTIHDSQVLLLPDNKEGAALAEACAGFGRDLWKRMFPGVPGEVDYHAW